MKHSLLLKIAIALQLLTAIAHALSFLSEPVGTNDQEKMLIELMNTYQMDLGAGYHRTMTEVVNALSACFSLLYLLGALINWYLFRQQVSPNVMKGILGINLAIFGFTFALMVVLTFLPPIVMTGVTFVFLFGAWLKVRE